MNKKLFSVLAMLVLVCLAGCNDDKKQADKEAREAAALKNFLKSDFTPSPNKSWKF